jgi:outer membrane immunogenic protein
MQRLEAKLDALVKKKLDALVKENAALRDRVKRLETTGYAPATPVRVASRSNSASDALPVASNNAARTAHAANMPVKAAGPAQVNCPAHAFKGGYVGIHGGGVNYTANRTDNDDFIITFGGTYVQKKWGGLIGGQIGYNWTTCALLWGVEVDGSWARADVTTRNLPNIIPDAQLSVNSRFDGLITARARTGFVVENMLFYLTGGAAAVRTRTIWTENFIPDSFSNVEIKDWRWGWVAGFGSEWAWSDRVSLRSEVLYVDVPDREYTTTPVVTGPVPGVGFAGPALFTHSDSMWISRVGLNYRFAGGR